MVRLEISQHHFLLTSLANSVMSYYVGIDPGLEGGITLLYDHASTVELDIYDMPIMPTQLKKRTQMRIDGLAFWDLLQSWHAHDPVVCLEHLWGFGAAVNVGGEKGQFTFADDYGLLRGLLIASGFTILMAPPQTWQAGVGKEKCSDKTGSIKRAIELYPKHSQLLIKPGARTYSDGRAESLLIAHYCKMVAQTPLLRQILSICS